MHVVFLSHLAQPGAEEFATIATRLGLTEYEVRLALAAPTPSVLVHTADPERAADLVEFLRSRGHGAYAFDDETFVSSERMVPMDDFRLDADGVRRTVDGDLLGYGDVFAILRAIHGTTGEKVQTTLPRRLLKTEKRVTRVYERELVAYFFRRSGGMPWLLRERHASYAGLGSERKAISQANFNRTLERVAAAAPMAVCDDRLTRRHVADRLIDTHLRSSTDGIDLLAHLLAMTIASRSGSPYR